MRCPNPLATVDAYSASVSLLDGRTVDGGDIRFDADTYHFYLNGVDITNSLSQSEKASNFPKFDRAKDNLRAYNEAYIARTGKAPPPTGSTSTLGIFTKQMTEEPFKAPLESLDRAVGDFARSSGVQTLIITGIIGYGLWLYFQSRR